MIERYVQAFAARIPRISFRRRRICAEIREHLLDRVEAHLAAGDGPRCAVDKAIQDFGSCDEIAVQFEQQAPLDAENEAPLRAAGLLVLIAVGLYTCMHLISGLSQLLDSAIEWVQPIRILVFGIVLIEVLLGTALILSGSSRRKFRQLVFLGGILTILAGILNTVWATQTGMKTAHWEYYGIVGGLLIVLLGALLVTITSPNLLQKRIAIESVEKGSHQ